MKQNLLESTSIAEAFFKYFDIVPAVTKELLDNAYSIRYDVYCREFGWENVADFPDGREVDEFDIESYQVLIRHRESSQFAGCVRFVPGRSGRGLPFEQPCGEFLFNDVVDLRSLPPASYGEISRLVVVAGFRRRSGEVSTQAGNLNELDDRNNGPMQRFPHIAVGLYLSAAAIGMNLGMERAIALMEPRLARRLRILGLHFEQIGQELDYHGIRAPFQITRESLEATAHPELLDLMSCFRQHLSGVFEA